jgi:hypothetical protein
MVDSMVVNHGQTLAGRTLEDVIWHLAVPTNMPSLELKISLKQLLGSLPLVSRSLV